MTEADIIQAVWTLTDERRPGDHSPVAERQRDALIAGLDRIADLSKVMAALARAMPDDDKAFDNVDGELGWVIDQTGFALHRFRAARDCEGEA